MEEVTISLESGGYDIIAAGSLLTYRDKSNAILDIKFNDFNFSLDFEFNDLVENQEHQITLKVEEGTNKIIVNLYGFNDPLGRFNTEPILIGHHHKKRIFLNFIVTQMNTKSIRKLEYSLYIEKNEDCNYGK